MNEIDTSIDASVKSASGASSWILRGIVLLFAALSIGGYWYVTEMQTPESETESNSVERLAPAPIEESEGATGGSPGLPGETEKAISETEELKTSGNPEEWAVGVEENQVLPALDESDDFARNLLAGLSGRSEYARWIGMNHLIPKTVMLVDNLSKGAVPATRFRELAPKGTFSAIEKTPGHYLLDPKGYHRYDIYADTLASIDVGTEFRIYQTLKPLIDTAYQELGYPEGNFDSILRKAIRHLLATPVLSGEIALVRPSVMYRYADPEIESLSKAQKQLIRMGPRNARMIKSALKAFLGNLDRNVTEAMQGESSQQF